MDIKDSLSVKYERYIDLAPDEEFCTDYCGIINFLLQFDDFEYALLRDMATKVTEKEVPMYFRYSLNNILEMISKYTNVNVPLGAGSEWLAKFVREYRFSKIVYSIADDVEYSGYWLSSLGTSPTDVGMVYINIASWVRSFLARIKVGLLISEEFPDITEKLRKAWFTEKEIINLYNYQRIEWITHVMNTTIESEQYMSHDAIARILTMDGKDLELINKLNSKSTSIIQYYQGY